MGTFIMRNLIPGQVSGCPSWWHLKVMCKALMLWCWRLDMNALGARSQLSVLWPGSSQLPKYSTYQCPKVRCPETGTPGPFTEFLLWMEASALLQREGCLTVARSPLPSSTCQWPRALSTKPITVNLEYERQAKPGKRIKMLFQVTHTAVNDKDLVGAFSAILRGMGCCFFFFLIYFNLFYLFIFGCIGSLLLCTGFL